MRIESVDRLDVPADKIYPLVRDELQKLLPYLPDVDAVNEVSRDRESETRLRVVNEWKAKAQVPGMVKKFLPADVFNWTDRALWKDDEYCVDYTLDGFGYHVDGTNFFTPEGEGTLIKVTATVTIHPEKFKVPKLLFKKVFPALEGTVKKAIEPNMTALARGLRSYFAAE